MKIDWLKLSVWTLLLSACVWFWATAAGWLWGTFR